MYINLVSEKLCFNSFISSSPAFWKSLRVFEVNNHICQQTVGLVGGFPLYYWFDALSLTLLSDCIVPGLPVSMLRRRMVRVGILVFVQYKNALFLHSFIYVGCGFVIDGFITLVLSLSTFGWVLNHKWMLDFVECFSASTWDDHVIFGLKFCLCGISPCRLMYIGFIIWFETHLIMVDRLLICCWIRLR